MPQSTRRITASLVVALLLASHAAQAQRVTRASFRPTRVNPTRPVPRTSLATLPIDSAGSPHVGRWVLVGATIGAVAGLAYYRHSLGPSGEDFMAVVSIPICVGGGAAVGALVGWLIPTLIAGPSKQPLHARLQLRAGDR